MKGFSVLYLRSDATKPVGIFPTLKFINNFKYTGGDLHDLRTATRSQVRTSYSLKKLLRYSHNIDMLNEKHTGSVFKRKRLF